MSEGRLAMSQKERLRQAILSGVKEEKLSLVEASKKLKISYRQVKRLYKRYCAQGDGGLIHGNCGKASHRAYSERYKEAVLERYRSRYEGFGPVLACEKLASEGYGLSDETLRLWLIAEGLWEKKRSQ
ncbi:MAG: helix-turn-helix domain-containing protein [Proteobacteria bacterium]|nr:helix-turn-helix domain-containing protein [Pseudomonadota bacterium]